MPLTSKGHEILAAMKRQYGDKKGESVFYASINKGTIKGVHEDIGGDIGQTIAGKPGKVIGDLLGAREDVGDLALGFGKDVLSLSANDSRKSTAGAVGDLVGGDVGAIVADKAFGKQTGKNPAHAYTPTRQMLTQEKWGDDLLGIKPVEEPKPEEPVSVSGNLSKGNYGTAALEVGRRVATGGINATGFNASVTSRAGAIGKQLGGNMGAIAADHLMGKASGPAYGGIPHMYQDKYGESQEGDFYIPNNSRTRAGILGALGQPNNYPRFHQAYNRGANAAASEYGREFGVEIASPYGLINNSGRARNPQNVKGYSSQQQNELNPAAGFINAHFQGAKLGDYAIAADKAEEQGHYDIAQHLRKLHGQPHIRKLSQYEAQEALEQVVESLKDHWTQGSVPEGMDYIAPDSAGRYYFRGYMGQLRPGDNEGPIQHGDHATIGHRGMFDRFMNEPPRQTLDQPKHRGMYNPAASFINTNFPGMKREGYGAASDRAYEMGQPEIAQHLRKLWGQEAMEAGLTAQQIKEGDYYVPRESLMRSYYQGMTGRPLDVEVVPDQAHRDVHGRGAFGEPHGINYDSSHARQRDTVIPNPAAGYVNANFRGANLRDPLIRGMIADHADERGNRAAATYLRNRKEAMENCEPYQAQVSPQAAAMDRPADIDNAKADVRQALIDTLRDTGCVGPNSVEIVAEAMLGDPSKPLEEGDLYVPPSKQGSVKVALFRHAQDRDRGATGTLMNAIAGQVKPKSGFNTPHVTGGGTTAGPLGGHTPFGSKEPPTALHSLPTRKQPIMGRYGTKISEDMEQPTEEGTFDQMVSHLQSQGHSKESATKIAGYINNKYVHHHEAVGDVSEMALPGALMGGVTGQIIGGPGGAILGTIVGDRSEDYVRKMAGKLAEKGYDWEWAKSVAAKAMDRIPRRTREAQESHLGAAIGGTLAGGAAYAATHPEHVKTVLHHAANLSRDQKIALIGTMAAAGSLAGQHLLGGSSKPEKKEEKVEEGEHYVRPRGLDREYLNDYLKDKARIGPGHAAMDHETGWGVDRKEEPYHKREETDEAKKGEEEPKKEGMLKRAGKWVQNHPGVVMGATGAAMFAGAHLAERGMMRKMQRHAQNHANASGYGVTPKPGPKDVTGRAVVISGKLPHHHMEAIDEAIPWRAIAGAIGTQALDIGSNIAGSMIGDKVGQFVVNHTGEKPKHPPMDDSHMDNSGGYVHEAAEDGSMRYEEIVDQLMKNGHQYGTACRLAEQMCNEDGIMEAGLVDAAKRFTGSAVRYIAPKAMEYADKGKLGKYMAVGAKKAYRALPPGTIAGPAIGIGAAATVAAANRIANGRQDYEEESVKGAAVGGTMGAMVGGLPGAAIGAGVGHLLTRDSGGEEKQPTQEAEAYGTRYKIEHMPNGLTHVQDRHTGLRGLYHTGTGEYHSGDLRGYGHLAKIKHDSNQQTQEAGDNWLGTAGRVMGAVGGGVGGATIGAVGGPASLVGGAAGSVAGERVGGALGNWAGDKLGLQRSPEGIYEAMQEQAEILKEGWRGAVGGGIVGGYGGGAAASARGHAEGSAAHALYTVGGNLVGMYAGHKAEEYLKGDKKEKVKEDIGDIPGKAGEMVGHVAGMGAKLMAAPVYLTGRALGGVVKGAAQETGLISHEAKEANAYVPPNIHGVDPQLTLGTRLMGGGSIDQRFVHSGIVPRNVDTKVQKVHGVHAPSLVVAHAMGPAKEAMESGMTAQEVKEWKLGAGAGALTGAALGGVVSGGDPSAMALGAGGGALVGGVAQDKYDQNQDKVQNALGPKLSEQGGYHPEKTGEAEIPQTNPTEQAYQDGDGWQDPPAIVARQQDTPATQEFYDRLLAAGFSEHAAGQVIALMGWDVPPTLDPNQQAANAGGEGSILDNEREANELGTHQTALSMSRTNSDKARAAFQSSRTYGSAMPTMVVQSKSPSPFRGQAHASFGSRNVQGAIEGLTEALREQWRQGTPRQGR